MSIGNLKDYGNKGNNFPFQLKVLEGLQAVIDNNCCRDIIEILSRIDTNIAPKVTIPKIILSTGDSATLIADNVSSISFASIGTADALVSFDGGATYVTLTTGTTVNMDAGPISDYYQGGYFSYDTATNAGSSLLITYNIG